MSITDKVINNSSVGNQTKRALRRAIDTLVIEAGGVTSVNGEVGVVVLSAADVGAATEAQGELADSAVQPAAIADMVVQSEIADMVESTDVDTIVVLTQAAYDALDPPVSTTLYVVVG